MSSIGQKIPLSTVTTEQMQSLPKQAAEVLQKGIDSAKDAKAASQAVPQSVASGISNLSPNTASGALSSLISGGKSGNLAGAMLQGEPMQAGTNPVDPSKLQAALQQAMAQGGGNNSMTINSDPALGGTQPAAQQVAQPQTAPQTQDQAPAQQQPSTFDQVAQGISDVLPVAGGLIKEAGSLFGIK